MCVSRCVLKVKPQQLATLQWWNILVLCASFEIIIYIHVTCTIWWFTTSQLWLTVGCWLNCQQRLISCVPTACLSLRSVYDDWVRTFALEGQSPDTEWLWWHHHAVVHDFESRSLKAPHTPTSFGSLSLSKRMHSRHKAGILQSLKPVGPSATQHGLLMLQQELSVWSGCGVAAKKKSGNETWPT